MVAVGEDKCGVVGLGEAGRERAAREFGWDAIARRTVALYESVLRK